MVACSATMLTPRTRIFGLMCVLLFFIAPPARAQQRIESLHQQASDAYRAGTLESLSTAITLWNEALAICEQRDGCPRQERMYRNVAASYLWLAQLDSALVYTGEAVRLSRPELLTTADSLLAESPTRTEHQNDSMAVLSEEFLAATQDLIAEAVPLRATAGLLPESAHQAEAALQALLSAITVSVTITSAPDGMQVRYREKPSSTGTPETWTFATTNHTGQLPLIYSTNLQICYGTGASRRMIIQKCKKGCSVVVPRRDAQIGCNPD